MARLAAGILFTLSLLAKAGPAAAVLVTLNPGANSSYIQALAEDQNGAASLETANPLALPYLNSLSAVDGANSVDTTIVLSSSAFRISFQHTRGDLGFNSTAFSAGNLFFSVSSDVEVFVDGRYIAEDEDGRTTYLSVLVNRVNSPVTRYESTQESRSTPNESFTVGGAGGDFRNRRSLQQRFTLFAGDEYSLQYAAYIQASPSAATGPATANGLVKLTFIPEPSTALLLGGGLLALGRRRPSS